MKKLNKTLLIASVSVTLPTMADLIVPTGSAPHPCPILVSESLPTGPCISIAPPITPALSYQSSDYSDTNKDERLTWTPKYSLKISLPASYTLVSRYFPSTNKIKGRFQDYGTVASYSDAKYFCESQGLILPTKHEIRAWQKTPTGAITQILFPSFKKEDPNSQFKRLVWTDSGSNTYGELVDIVEDLDIRFRGVPIGSKDGVNPVGVENPVVCADPLYRASSTCPQPDADLCI